MEAVKIRFGLASLVGGPCIVVVRHGRPHIRTYNRWLAGGMTHEQAITYILALRVGEAKDRLTRILNENLFSVGGIDRSSNQFWRTGA